MLAFCIKIVKIGVIDNSTHGLRVRHLFLRLLCVLFLVANIFEGFLKFRDFARLRILMGGRHRDYVTKQNFRHHFAFFSIFSRMAVK